jgi:hypothetical protein
MCSNGKAVCPDCSSEIQPTNQHSGTATVLLHNGITGFLWNGECSAKCKGITAKGLNASVAVASPFTQPTMSPMPPTRAPSAPAVVHLPASTETEGLRLKFKERLQEATFMALAQGHSVPRVIIYELGQDKLYEAKCSVCQANLRVNLVGNGLTEVYNGSALAFTCKQLQKRI